MFNKLKKGFTLVELIVVLALMGLITTAIVMIMRPTTNAYVDSTNKANEEVSAITLFDYINGELRYSTDVEVKFSDDSSTMPAAKDSCKNFIMLSNEERPQSKKGARGIAMHGLVSDLSGATYCVSPALLDEFDFQFSLNGYMADSTEGDADTSTVKQSLSITADVHPMMATIDSFIINEDKPYTVTETFQFINLQQSAKLNRKIGTLKIEENKENKPVMWIFYQRPNEAESKGTTAGSGGTGIPGSDGSIVEPPKPPAGDDDLNFRRVLKKSVTIHFMPSDLLSEYRLGGVSTTSDASIVGTASQTLSSPFDVIVEFSGLKPKDADDSETVFDESSTFTVYVNGSATGNVNFNLTGLTNIDYTDPRTEIWVKDGIAYESADKVPADAYGCDKTVVVHVLASAATNSRGVKVVSIPNGDFGEPSISNTSEVSARADNDITIHFSRKNQKADVQNIDNSGNAVSLISFESNDTMRDYQEIWVVNGVLYFEGDELPPPYEGFKEWRMIIHLIKDTSSNNQLVINRGSSGDYTDFTIDGNYNLYLNVSEGRDAYVDFTRETQYINLNVTNTSINYDYYASDPNTPREIWIYNGNVYTDIDAYNAAVEKDNQPEPEPEPLPGGGEVTLSANGASVPEFVTDQKTRGVRSIQDLGDGKTRVNLGKDDWNLIDVIFQKVDGKWTMTIESSYFDNRWRVKDGLPSDHSDMMSNVLGSMQKDVPYELSQDLINIFAEDYNLTLE